MIILSTLSLLYFLSLEHAEAASSVKSDAGLDADTIIIGAGIAGLSAAEELIRNGHSKILILESSDRVGGRMFTLQRKNGNDVDLGAQWIHGRNTSIFSFAQSNGILGEELLIEDIDAFYNDAKFFTSSGRKISDDIGYYTFVSSEQIFQPENINFENSTMRKYFDEVVENIINSTSSFTSQEISDLETAMEGLAGTLETEYSEDIHNLSARVVLQSQDLFDIDNVLIPGGTKSIINKLLKTIPSDVIKLDEKVVNIDWSEELVAITTESNKFTAKQVIVTVSLGVLKADHEELFHPNLDEQKIQAINNMGFGNLGKIFLEWDQPWWSGNQVIITAWSKEEIISQMLPEEWYKSINQFISNSGADNAADNLLWMAVSGDGARVADTLPDGDITKTAGQILRQFTGNDSIPSPDRIIRHAWFNDPNFRGTYSYPGFDTVEDDYEQLMTPLSSTGRAKVFLAGEYTDPVWQGSMEAGRSSGVEQAGKIVAIL